MATACDGQSKPDPVPAPSPESLSDKSSEEASVPPKQTTDQGSESSDGLDQNFQTPSDTTQSSEPEDTTDEDVAWAADDANQDANQDGGQADQDEGQDVDSGTGDIPGTA